MDAKLISIKNELNALDEEKAMALMPFLKMFAPTIDEIETQEAYEIFGSRKRFDHHRKEGNIYPIRGFGKKARKFWSRIDVYNLKKAEQIVMKVV